MEETATISLKRLKELEKYEEALNEKKAVFYQSFGTYGFSRLTILSETETNNVYLLLRSCYIRFSYINLLWNRN